ncbi:MAG: hypothetical protein HKN12_08325 [Gemmatimonadetes bacterium]|nr:hypothetical protein [Gemmatimonadota bacterium]
MKLTTRILATALALFVLHAPSQALEKTTRPLVYDRSDEWGVTNTVTIAYYNNCTGWVWVWSGWSPGEKVGVCYNAGSAGCSLNTTWALTFSPAPSGYGFTGTIQLETECDCTGNVLAAQPYLGGPSGWNATAWGVAVPSTFLVAIRFAAPTGLTNPDALASDHPFAGPTGPTACGTCFPTTRSVKTLYYGINGASCPGVTLSDGLCDIEMMWEVAIKCAVPVEQRSWGTIKGLFR